MSSDDPDAPVDAGEEAILRAWTANAASWTAAVRGGAIASRRLVTDRAVVDAVLAGAPRQVLDIGCGEGWLARALAAGGATVLGTDAVPALVESARQAGGGEFLVMDHAAIAGGALAGRRFDAVVANFSLLGGAVVDSLLAALPSLLAPGGRVVVQTLHPSSACGDGPCRDGWREGTWADVEGALGEPAPWYFRTVAGWLASLAAAGLSLQALHEPLHPHTGRPASLLMVGVAARR